MDARAAIDLPMRVKNPMDVFGQLAIFSLVCAGFPLVPVVIATDTDPEYPAHRRHRILLAMLSNKGVTQFWMREKMASASDRISPNLLIFE
jgi:hypothetical protein